MTSPVAIPQFHGASLGSRIIGTCATLLALSTLFVGLRCYVRLSIVKRFGADDWLLNIGMAFFIATVTTTLLAVHYGLGTHVDQLSMANMLKAPKYMILIQWFYIPSTTMVKLSIAVLLYRLAITPFYRYSIVLLCVPMVLWNTTMLGITIFQCSPISLAWNQGLAKPGDGHCLAVKILTRCGYAFSATDIFYNFAFALIPIPMLWNVQMTRRARFAIFSILSLGCLASIATIVRLKYVVSLEDSVDKLYSYGYGVLWTVVEVGLGIIAAAIASLRPLLRKVKIPFSTKGSRNTSSGGRGTSLRIIDSSQPRNGYVETLSSVSEVQLTGKDNSFHAIQEA